jgi:hypothetical protein
LKFFVSTNTDHFHYFVYGQQIKSAIPLPQLVPGGDGSDVRITRGRVTDPNPTASNTAGSRLAGRELKFSLKGVGAAAVLDGRTVTIDAAQGVSEQHLSLFVVEVVLALVMLQRGHLVLHGSAVTVGDGVIGLVGHQQTGKSVIAAAFYQQGVAVMSDNQLVFERTSFSPASPVVLPGYPQLELWPEDARLVGIEPEKFRLLRPNISKVAWPVTDNFRNEANPVRSLYILTKTETPGVDKYSLRDGFFELTRHTFAAYLAEQQLFNQAEHFTQCMRIVKSVPVYRLQLPKNISDPHHIVNLILNNEGLQ